MSEGHILEKQKTRAGLYADVFSIQCILFFFIILWCSVCIQNVPSSPQQTLHITLTISHAVQL